MLEKNVHQQEGRKQSLERVNQESVHNYQIIIYSNYDREITLSGCNYSQICALSVR